LDWQYLEMAMPFQMKYAPNNVRKLRQAGLTEEKIRSMFMADD
jgi:hypothetical protein